MQWMTWRGRGIIHLHLALRFGRTPNPDMLCNSRVKFGAFREHLHGTFPGRFDRIASGHYAALSRPDPADAAAHPADAADPASVAIDPAVESGAADAADPGQEVKLVMSGDLHKDQTYFLAHLSQEQLSGLSFPIGRGALHSYPRLLSYMMMHTPGRHLALVPPFSARLELLRGGIT
jgi:hypothetical protein